MDKSPRFTELHIHLLALRAGIETASKRIHQRPTVGLLVWVLSALPCCAQVPAIPTKPVAAVIKDQRFETPQATIRSFRNAVSQRRWRDEYECYTDRPKARFSYWVITSAWQLRDSEDIAEKVNLAFQSFHVPKGLLERFPARGITDLSDLNERQVEQVLKAQQQEMQRRIKIWESEFFPLDIDWAGLIEELQPLYREDNRRRQGGGVFSLNEMMGSQIAIVHLLDYHTFDRVWDLETQEDRAEGTIVARIRDPDATTTNPEGARRFATRVWQDLFSVDAWQGCAGRRAEKISLVRLNEGWKISAVPFR